MTTPENATHSWPAPSAADLPTMEQTVLRRWEQHDIVARSLAQNPDGPSFVFYEGPPTANGTPGTHHVEARSFKDVIPRHRTMKGHWVPRKGGWDCHGLPVELAVEKALGLNSKREIEDYGIAAFNQKCRESVQQFVGEWEELTARIGFWVDMDDAYRTMDATYVDSMWWALKTMWDDGLVFQDHRVTPYCGRCGTGLSDAELAQGYQTVDDPSVFVSFPVLEGPLADEDASLLVWTTTPWTLPSNTAVAIGPDIDYVLVRAGDQLLVVAAALREKVLGEDSEVVRTVAHEELIGRHYRAPFTIVETDQDHRYVTTADFVTTTDGSGMVHLAPAFGADDMEIGRREGLPVLNPVGEDGCFTSGPWAGQFVKDADPAIVAQLEADGVLIRHATYSHTYPFCWRCQTPLIYWAKPSWYVRTTSRRDDLLANNSRIDWHPDHIREGRFGNWLENNIDWSLSRDRYWGTPLPFWGCADCGEYTVVGSRAELGGLAGIDTSELDPHRPGVDEITIPCDCGGTRRRVPEVADTWFDSGGMPWGQHGYPHIEGSAERFEAEFPADYICEAIDQTRGWFYTLLAESTLLFNTSSYKTVLCLGHIVDDDGKKMSKSVGNILDPWELINRHGADALRWQMFADGNPWVNRRVGHGTVEDVVRRFLLTLWNTHGFFLTYAAIDGYDASAPTPAVVDRPASDRWILAELADLVTVVDDAMTAFDVSLATRRIEQFTDDLSNWYVRRNRRRFWRDAGDDPSSKQAAYATLHAALTTLATVMAPFTPFVSDQIHHDLVLSQDHEAPASVHLLDWPIVPDHWHDDELRAATATLRRLTELGRQARNNVSIGTRQPLRRAIVTVPSSARAAVIPLLGELKDELNLHDIEVTDGTSALVDLSVKPNYRALGPAFQQDAPAVAAALSALDDDGAQSLRAAIQASGSTEIDVLGTSWVITAEMVEILETPRTGWAMATDEGHAVALDTTLDHGLRMEGAAREVIRAVNDIRKAMGLSLTDRISLGLTTIPSELRGDLDAAGLLDLVASDVLAAVVDQRHGADTETQSTLNVEELGTITVTVHR